MFGGNRELTFDDYIRILRRRLWVIVIPVIVAPLAAYLFSLTLANRYTSQTLVMIEQPKVPDNLVKPVVVDDLLQRLQTMQEQILSRTRLQPIIDRFGLYKKDLVKAPAEEVIEKMRKDISVRTVRADRGVSGFYISYTAPAPRLAQQVCAEITSMFMQENLNLQVQRAEGTTAFLRGQLEQAKANLDEQDKKLAAFKQHYIGQLPGQEQTNMNILTGLNTQLDAVTQSLSRAQQDKVFMESMLAQQVADWKSQQGTPENPKAVDDRLAKLQQELTAAEARYTEDHPDVVKLKKEIAALKAKSDAQPVSPAAHEDTKPSAAEPAQIKQLRLNVHQLVQTIQEKSKEQERLRLEISKYEARIQMSPVVEEQFKALTRDYQTALGFYNDLLSKKTQSEMATDLERKQQGEQFRIMDPPNLPEEPTFPNRRMITLAGFVVGIGIGLGIAFLFEMRNRVIRSEDDVTFYLGLPTLALVPSVDKTSVSKGRRQAAVAN
jgi:polysaccharide chain length determinant protein (PEP-CTERM system associated)